MVRHRNYFPIDTYIKNNYYIKYCEIITKRSVA